MKLDDFKLGWIIGDFEPAIYKTKDIEVGVKYYEPLVKEPKHLHKIATEYTIILEGRVKVNGIEYSKGDLIKIDKNQISEFETLEKTITLVVKSPSAPGDKYIV
jgi:anti-sigma factor ChrR (cupin superfamily)